MNTFCSNDSTIYKVIIIFEPKRCYNCNLPQNVEIIKNLIGKNHCYFHTYWKRILLYDLSAFLWNDESSRWMQYPSRIHTSLADIQINVPLFTDWAASRKQRHWWWNDAVPHRNWRSERTKNCFDFQIWENLTEIEEEFGEVDEAFAYFCG